MSTTPSYIAENAAERERLRRLLARLSDADFDRPLGDDWTVGATLAHLAFWDRRNLAVLERWQREGVKPAPTDPDSINEAVCYLGLALSPRAVAGLVLAAAETIDRAVEQVKLELAAEIEALGYDRVLYRARHRREHLEQIEQALPGLS